MPTYENIGGFQTKQSKSQNIINDIVEIEKQRVKKKKSRTSRQYTPAQQPITSEELLTPKEKEPVTAIVNEDKELTGIEDPNRGISRKPTTEEKRDYEIQTRTTITEQRLGASLTEDKRNMPAEEVIAGGKDKYPRQQSINTGNVYISDDVSLSGGKLIGDFYGLGDNMGGYNLDTKEIISTRGPEKPREDKGGLGAGYKEAIVNVTKPTLNVLKFDTAYLSTTLQAPFVSRERTVSNIKALQILKDTLQLEKQI